MLKNKIYIGCLLYNKTKILPNKKREKRIGSEMVEIPTTPIVEDWIFELAQDRFKENQERIRQQPRRFYLLGGLIICDDCERPYITQTYNIGKQRRINESQLYRHRTTHGHCSNKSILAKVIEPMVWDEIIQLLKDTLPLFFGDL